MSLWQSNTIDQTQPPLYEATSISSLRQSGAAKRSPRPRRSALRGGGRALLEPEPLGGLHAQQPADQVLGSKLLVAVRAKMGSGALVWSSCGHLCETPTVACYINILHTYNNLLLLRSFNDGNCALVWKSYGNSSESPTSHALDAAVLSLGGDLLPRGARHGEGRCPPRRTKRATT